MKSQEDLIEIPSGGPLFEGHFPGRPILPGVAQIGLILAALSRRASHPLSLNTLYSMRLRQPVLPGDRLTLATRPQPLGRLRFELRRGEAMVSHGEMSLAGLSQTAPGGSAPCSPSLRTDIAWSDRSDVDVAGLLPHRPPMHMIKRVIRSSAAGIDCQAQASGECGLVEQGRLPAYAAVEAAAQAAAVWEALTRSAVSGTHEPRLGYLVALRELVTLAESVSCNQLLAVSVRLRDAALPLTRYDVEVTSRAGPLVRGQIATMLIARPLD